MWLTPLPLILLKSFAEIKKSFQYSEIFFCFCESFQYDEIFCSARIKRLIMRLQGRRRVASPLGPHVAARLCDFEQTGKRAGIWARPYRVFAFQFMINKGKKNSPRFIAVIGG